MKTLFFIFSGLFCFSTSVFAELSVADLEKIRQIVSESETRLEKRIAEQGERFSAEIRAQGERMTEQGKRLDFLGALMIALIVAIIAFVGVPLGFIAYPYNRHRGQQDAEIRALREKIERLQRQILKT